MSIMDMFPLDSPRKSQVEVIKAIEKAYKEGYENIVLEAPVGSGKSAIAITLAKHIGKTHILTPMKSLQDQYHDDFNGEGLVLMKGRSSYPCTYYEDEASHKKILSNIISGKKSEVESGFSCSNAPCLNSKKIWRDCKDRRDCPYIVAIDAANNNEYVVHNLHSFIFQAYFMNRFEKRSLLVIDECHRIEDIVRGFASKKISIPTYLTEEELLTVKSFKTLSDWVTWLETFHTLFSEVPDSSGVSNRDKFLNNTEFLLNLSDKFGEKFFTSVTPDRMFNKTVFEFIPENVADLANNLLFNFGEKRLFMSGTIYSKNAFCKSLGLKDESTCFIRIGSTFPKSTRPIYAKKQYMVDTSHKLWDQNYSTMISKIREIMNIFDDVKGLIHTPSYKASQDIHRSLRDTGRVIQHDSNNFQEELLRFYEEENPLVFISPICQQGVDFKYDRANFQIIIRVPYLNTSDVFVAGKVNSDFAWYNHQALVSFGQQIGRINRADDDFGVTILMDERFTKFIHRNRSILPKWMLESIIT